MSRVETSKHGRELAVATMALTVIHDGAGEEPRRRAAVPRRRRAAVHQLLPLDAELVVVAVMMMMHPLPVAQRDLPVPLLARGAVP